MRAHTILLALALAMPGLPRAEELKWFRGNTHTHTNNSDGNASPDAVVRWYKDHGYQFVFITDHEHVTDITPLNALFGATERFLVLPGQEITQWGADKARSAAHINSLFTAEVIWPLGDRTCRGGGCGATAAASIPLADTFESNIASVIAAKGIPQVNHPNYRWAVKPEDLFDIPASGCLLEIWNGQGQINNLGGTGDNGETRPSAEGYWDVLLSRGTTVWGVASDDSHDFGDQADPHGAAPGQAWIVVRAPALTSSHIEAALRAGDFYASTGVTLTEIRTSSTELSLTIGESRTGTARYLTRFIGKDSKVVAEASGAKPSYRFKGGEMYVRASITDSNGRRAWTQPVFIKSTFHSTP